MAAHCTLCGFLIPPSGKPGRPRTTHYPKCPIPAELATVVNVLPADVVLPPAPPRLQLVADPFNSTPATAPLPPSRPPAQDDGHPGPIERQLVSELEHVVTTNPLAGTLSQVALRCARAADRAAPDDLKAVLAAVKELRAIMAEISKSHAGGDDDGIDDTPVGSSRPEIRNSPSW